MAINQILSAVDEIIDGTPKYNITDNGDGTKGIELANVVAQQGTALNKACLDKIDNVLSYLTPSVEKVAGTPVEKTSSIHFMPTNWTTITTDKIYSSTYTLENGESGDVTISTNDNYSSGVAYDLHNAFDGTESSNSFRLNKNGTFLVEFNNPICISNMSFRLGSVNTITISGSNDNIDYTQLGTTTNASSGVGEATTTYSNNYYYKYYKFTNNSPSYNYSNINEVRFIEYKYMQTPYQNQFTLDNNTSFTNNQRVLVDIKDIVTTETISGNYNLLPTDFIIESTIKISGNCTDENNIGFIAESTNNDVSKAFNGNESDYWISSYTNDKITITLDRNIRIKKLKFKAYGDDGRGVTLEIGGNNIGTYRYTTLQELELENPILSNNIIIKNSNTSYGFYVYEFQITEWEYSIEHHSFDLTGVESNTLNGIDIPTLLQPSTKYELIYKEDTNKFIFNEKPNLLDITLTENINEISVSGLFSKFKPNVLYECLIYGGVTYQSQIYLGGITMPLVYMKTNTLNTFISFFAFGNINNNVYKYSSLTQSSSSFGNNANSLTNPTDIIKVGDNNNLVAGTRIIIKEIS